MPCKKVAVIGAGLGGLSAAVRLAHQGYDVDIFESNSKVGGKANEINIRDFRFDTGPSLLTMPSVLKELFESVDEKQDDYLHFSKLEILCKYFYPDGTIINAFSDIIKFADEVETKTSVKKRTLINYLSYCKQIYDLTAELFLYKSFSEPKTFLNKQALKTLVNIRKIDPFRTMHEANNSFFEDEKIVRLFDRYATYNGSDPFASPATLNIIPHVENNIGGYIAEKGMYSIPSALKILAEKKGVSFHFNSKVKKIHLEKRKVVGITASEENYPYDIVVSNSDINNTYKNLLGDSESRLAKRYSKLEKSSSALVFYWGIDILSDLEIHNILFSENYKKEFDELFRQKVVPEDPTVYIYISSKFKLDDAPGGKENWFVMINAPYNISQDWQNEVIKTKKHIIKKIKTNLGIDIENKIICESVLTPPKIETQTGSIGGSIYGISSNTKMAAFLRHQNRSKKYKGLYFCGGSAHPGGGIPLVLLSGKITSDLIKKYEIN